MTNAEFLEMRDVEVPCEKCGGWGVRAYGSTSTWHGGIGGQMITSDVCDRCWGSGDEKRRWPSHRLLRTGSAPPSVAGVSDTERLDWMQENNVHAFPPSHTADCWTVRRFDSPDLRKAIDAARTAPAPREET